MKKFLKVGLLVLVLLSTASMLFAGGGNQASGTTTVRLGIYPNPTMEGDIAQHQRWMTTYHSRFPNYRIEPAHYEYAIDTFMPLAQSGRLPTLFDSWFTEPPKLISGNFVRDITAEVRALGWDTKMNPAMLNLVSQNGRIYGVPRDAYALGMHVNVALFREAGLVDRNGIPLYPRTWAELVDVAKQIKERTGKAGLVLLAKDNAGGWHFSNIAWNFGATFMVQQGNRWVATINTPEVREALQYVMDLKWVHDVLTADPTNEDWGTGFRAIGTGEAAMYIGAADAVDQPTFNNGLPVGDLAIVPIPAGPRGHQYSLMGGTVYMFAQNATSEQVTAGLRYLEIMGRAPEVNETVIAGLRADAQRRSNDGIPVIRDVPAWTYEPYLRAQQEARDAFSNVDQRLFADYFSIISQGTNLRPEEPQLAQDLYAELTKCLQEVLTNRNANPAALLAEAQTNFQRLLDQQVNR